MIGETIGNFRVIARIGAGGMGEVLVAEQKSIETKVAIKVLRPEISVDRQQVDRFFNEARAVSRIKHAGTVKIFDVGFHSTGHAYLVMEYLEGETLAARIQRTGRLSIAQISDIGRQTSGVLEATHAAGITHRDLKPENIFLIPDSELASRERVKILDFGIAKLTGTMSGGAQKTQGTMGTPAYMAPEQWGDASKVDWRADIYSLGCLTFEMATGRPPFVSSNFAEACGKHLSEPPPKLRSILPSAPEPLETMLDAMLAKTIYGRPPLRDIAKMFEQLGTGLAHGYDETLPPRPSQQQPVAVTMAADAPTHAPVVHNPTPVGQQTPANLAVSQQTPVNLPAVGQQTPANFPQVAPTVASSPSIPKQQTTLSSATGSSEVPPKKSRTALFAIGGVVVAGGVTVAIIAASGGSKPVVTTAPADATTAQVDTAVVTGPPDAAVDAPPSLAEIVIADVKPEFVTIGGLQVMPQQVTRGQYAKLVDAISRTRGAEHPYAKAFRPLKDMPDVGKPDRAGEPMAWVTFEQAQDFCATIKARLPTQQEWLAASNGSWRIGTAPDELVLREWTSTVTSDGLAIVMGGTSRMTDTQRIASIKNPLSKPTVASAGKDPPPESVAGAMIGVRCVRADQTTSVQSSNQEFLPEFERFKNKMCACKDKACTENTRRDWDVKKKTLPKDSLTDDQQKKEKDIVAELARCYVATGAVAPTVPAAPAAPRVPAPAPAAPVSCDDATQVAAIETKADQSSSAGNWAAALRDFESILACKPAISSKAYLAACRAHNFSRAKVLFRAAGSRDALAQVCMKEGYDPRAN